MGSHSGWGEKNYRVPSKVPDHSILLFGANPCHSPARESVRPAECPACSSRAGRPDDPVRDYEVSVTANGTMTGEPATAVCLCGRSVWDHTPALARAVKRRLEDDPEAGTDRKDADRRTAEAVTKGSGTKSKGRVEYSAKAAYADYVAKLRSRRRVPKS